ncbi:hypothetical protein L3Q82_000313 [Scortum barcoo]|uniref:Uncharacterized protein n=1 Tax=Scortum barcoo TaxID=214431 RepID=A0ACB8XBJ8_9TELE|nr:hypothetical protein L3Q82_000313 [Scortum barcoo]
MPPGHLPREVFQVCPIGRTPPGKTQDTLERQYLLAGLGMPRSPPGRVGGSVWGEEVSGFTLYLHAVLMKSAVQHSMALCRAPYFDNVRAAVVTFTTSYYELVFVFTLHVFGGADRCTGLNVGTHRCDTLKVYWGLLHTDSDNEVTECKAWHKKWPARHERNQTKRFTVRRPGEALFTCVKAKFCTTHYSTVVQTE